MSCTMTMLSPLLPCYFLPLFALTAFNNPTANGLAFSPQQLIPQNIQFPNPFNLQPKKSTFTYTHLECNGQLWQISTSKNSKPISIVVDPLASQLDFGIPWGYRANKRVLTESSTIDIIRNASPTHCLLTMGLDDHTHLPTLTKLKDACPDLKYVVAPSCEKKLLEAGFDADKITVLRHGQSSRLEKDDATTSNTTTTTTTTAEPFGKVTATVGALVGPPWQTRENGYLLEIPASDASPLSIYYEPHADTLLPSLRQHSIRAQIVISPVTRQSLPAQVPPSGQFTLVYGGERTLEIGEALGASVFVPLGNGALDVEGPLAGLVEASGGVDNFEKLVKERNERIGRDGKDGTVVMRVARAEPGAPVVIAI
ncbi:hypothetical protein ACHAXS_012327 [Conticribra weissflogii]